jgi:hypothetical protein
MMNIFSTIIPIFIIIILGWMARVYGFIQAEFIEPANRLVFYLYILEIILLGKADGLLPSKFSATR